MPEQIVAIKERGYVVWAKDGPSDELRSKFPDERIKIGRIRHIRIWGIQVDDERELLGHERTSIPDEELWQVELLGSDGSSYEVNASLVRPAT